LFRPYFCPSNLTFAVLSQATVLVTCCELETGLLLRAIFQIKTCFANAKAGEREKRKII
jgi:hypothetical protein